MSLREIEFPHLSCILKMESAFKVSAITYLLIASIPSSHHTLQMDCMLPVGVGVKSSDWMAEASSGADRALLYLLL